MNRFFTSFAVLVFTSLSLAQVNVGDSPKLKFKSYTDNTEVDLEALRGKIVVVDFWATWCGPCMAEADHMVAINKEWGPKGMQFIGISLDQEGQGDAMKQVAQEKGFDWPQHFDGKFWKNKFAKEWGINSIPATFIISPDGEVLWKGHPSRIDGELKKAFEKHPPRDVMKEMIESAEKTLTDSLNLLDKKQPIEAMKLYGTIPAQVMKSKDFEARKKEADAKFAEAGKVMLAEVDPLIEKKQYQAAIDKLSAIANSVKGLPIAADAKRKLTDLMNTEGVKAALEAEKNEKTAREMFDAGKAFQTKGNHDGAYERFNEVLRLFAETPTAKLAAVETKKYESDPAFVKRMRDAAAKDRATAMLSLADNYRKNGRNDAARAKLQELIDEFPGTTYAEKAKSILDGMK